MTDTRHSYVVNVRTGRHEVYIGRPSKWGNQWSHKSGTLAQYRVETIEEAVAKHREWFLAPEQAELRAEAKRELRGKFLGCYGCNPCHGWVIAEVANS